MRTLLHANLSLSSAFQELFRSRWRLRAISSGMTSTVFCLGDNAGLLLASERYDSADYPQCIGNPSPAELSE